MGGPMGGPMDEFRNMKLCDCQWIGLTAVRCVALRWVVDGKVDRFKNSREFWIVPVGASGLSDLVAS